MLWDITIKCLFDERLRSTIAHRIVECLNLAVPNSSACLRGSLADGRPDEYSDIDVLWVVDDLAAITVSRVREILSQAGEIVSLQVDPEVQRSPRHRLIFVRFATLPLFWRIELKISSRTDARSVSKAKSTSELVPDWSVAESAIANAVGAIKAWQRGMESLARRYLESALDKLECEMASPNARDCLIQLSKRATQLEPHVAPFAEDLQAMIAE